MPATRTVVLCERGIRTFETATRNTLDLNSVALVRELSHLPIIVDPSHGTGKASLVKPMSLASRAVGAHGADGRGAPGADPRPLGWPAVLGFRAIRALIAALGLSA